jgi:hypothetical protein
MISDPWSDDVIDHLAVHAKARGSLIRYRMAFQIFCCQVSKSWFYAALMALFHGIVAVPNPCPEFPRLNPRRCNSQFRMAANGVAPLAARNTVVKNETRYTGSSDPHAKTRNLRIPLDPVSLFRGIHLFYGFLSDSLPHTISPSVAIECNPLPNMTRCVNTVSTKIARDWLSMSLSVSGTTSNFKYIKELLYNPIVSCQHGKVEQLIRNQQVIGSSPIVGSICFEPMHILLRT